MSKRLAVHAALHAVAWITATLLGSSGTSWAKPEGPPASVVHWENAKGEKGESELILSLSVGDLLTKKQRQMIEGGFTTFSQLSLFAADSRGEADRERELFQIRCSVKYDAWEEEYDVAQLLNQPQTKLLRSFNAYADLCLQSSLSIAAITEAGLVPGRMLIAELSVIQTSIEEEAKIKEWLISQQSGVMQTLFSHMLGELSLHQKLTVKLNIPQIPDALGRTTPEPGKGKG